MQITLKWLKIASVLMVVGGLIVIYMASLGVSAPLVRISDVYGNYAMNYAVVRLRGNVTSPPYVEVTSGKITIKIWISDGSGEIGIYVYDAQARELLQKGILPMPGDTVDVEAQVRVRDQYTYVILQLAEQLKVYRISSGYTKTQSLDVSMSNKLVSVEGVASGIRNVSSGILFYVDTGSERVTVLIPRVLMYLNSSGYREVIDSLDGAHVVVGGVVYLYKGVSPEIVVRSLEEITFRSVVKRVGIAELEEYLNQEVSLKVRLERIFYSNGIYKIEVSDEEGKVNVTVSKDLMLDTNPKYMFTSNTLEIVGRVVKEGGEVTVVASSLKPNPTQPSLTNISSATKIGVALALRGRASGLYVGSKGYAIFTLQDDTGSIRVYVPGWSYVSEEVRNAVKNGEIVILYGYIDVYRGELEIIVYNSRGIEVG